MFRLTPFNQNVVRREANKNSLSDYVDDFFRDDYDTFKEVKEENSSLKICQELKRKKLSLIMKMV